MRKRPRGARWPAGPTDSARWEELGGDAGEGGQVGTSSRRSPAEKHRAARLWDGAREALVPMGSRFMRSLPSVVALWL
ncbi:MAG: hypothetical protein ACKOFW_02195, partial [Planctomycetaceae bacterium]